MKVRWGNWFVEVGGFREGDSKLVVSCCSVMYREDMNEKPNGHRFGFYKVLVWQCSPESTSTRPPIHR